MKHNEVALVARTALDYIDALPKDVVATLPAMPGFDRDWAENVLASGVPDDVLEQAAPIDRRFTVDMSGAQMPEDAERTEAFIDAMRAREIGGFTNTQLIAHIMDKAARIKPDRQIDSDHRKEALMNLRILEIALSTLKAKPFMYGIADPDGGPHFAEFCVSGNLQHIEKEVETLNAIDEIDVNCEPHYRVAPLYRLPEMK